MHATARIASIVSSTLDLAKEFVATDT